MAAGLNKATNYYNNVESRRQFAQAVRLAKLYNVRVEAMNANPLDMGWRKLDRLTTAIMDAINEQAKPALAVTWDSLRAAPPPPLTQKGASDAPT